MPKIVRIAEWANIVFNRENIYEVNPEVPAPGKTQVDVPPSRRRSMAPSTTP